MAHTDTPKTTSSKEEKVYGGVRMGLLHRINALLTEEDPKPVICQTSK